MVCKFEKLLLPARMAGEVDPCSLVEKDQGELCRVTARKAYRLTMVTIMRLLVRVTSASEKDNQ
jgi:hypothetical protein